MQNEVLSEQEFEREADKALRALERALGDLDGIEVDRPSEVPEFIDWLLNSPEAAAQNYGCYALDSWASYFSAKHSEMIAAVRASCVAKVVHGVRFYCGGRRPRTNSRTVAIAASTSSSCTVSSG